VVRRYLCSASHKNAPWMNFVNPRISNFRLSEKQEAAITS